MVCFLHTHITISKMFHASFIADCGNRYGPPTSCICERGLWMRRSWLRVWHWRHCCPVINPFPVCILNESLSRGFSCVIHNQDQLHIIAMYDYNSTSYRSHAKKYQSVQLIISMNLNVTPSHQQLFHVHLHLVAESVTVHTKWFIQITLLISTMMKWACRQKEFNSKHRDDDGVSHFLQAVQKWHALWKESDNVPWPEFRSYFQVLFNQSEWWKPDTGQIAS